MLAEIRALGFDHAELGHATRISLVDGIRAAVAAGEMRISALHNFCPLPLGLNGPAPDFYKPSSPRAAERQQVIRHTRRTIEFAASLGAALVVVHLGVVRMRDYTQRLLALYAAGRAESSRFIRLREKALAIRARKRQQALERVYQVLDAVVPVARAAGVRLGMETRLGLEEIPNSTEVGELIERYGSDVLGYWHDVGHAQVQEYLGLQPHEAWLERYRGRTLGMHLQDIAPPALDHLPPGEGEFDFDRLLPYITADMALTWELHPTWKPEQIKDRVAAVQDRLRLPLRT